MCKLNPTMQICFEYTVSVFGECILHTSVHVRDVKMRIYKLIFDSYQHYVAHVNAYVHYLDCSTIKTSRQISI